MFSSNESGADRIIRIAFGLGLGYMGLNHLTGNAATLILGISGVLLVTGIIGFCPLYALLRINTKHR